MGIKILVLHSYNIFSENNASSNRWRTIVEGLSERGSILHLIITSGYRSKREMRQYGRSGIISGKIKYTYLSNQKRYSYFRNRLNLYLLSWIYNRFNALELKRITRKEKPDIIFINTALDAMHTYYLAFQRDNGNIKLMTEINEFNDIWDVHMTNFLQKWRNKKSDDLLINKIFPRLNLCLVMTDTLINHYKALSGINPDLEFLKVPMTVDFRRFESVQENNLYKKPYIAYCGSGGFYTNGVDILINSFARISNSFPGLTLYIAAFRGNDEARMLELINENKLTEKVIYLGSLERGQIPSFLYGAELLALPRPDSKQAQGGFPTKLGEYLASGRPVCVTSVGEIPEYLSDNESAFMAIPGDVESFAKSMERCLRDPVNAKRVGENGKKVAQREFNMENQASHIYGFLERQI